MSGSSNQAPPADMERTVEEIRRMLDQVRQSHRAMRRRMTGGTILLLIFIIGFATLSYFKLKENFSREKVQEAAAIRARLLVPQLEPTIRTTLNEVAPFYLQMGQQRLQALSPRLEASVKQQADRLGQDLEAKMNAQLQDFFNHIANHASVQLRTDFPGLAADDGARVASQLKTILDARSDKVLTSMRQFYAEENKRIAAALARFPVPDVTGTDLETLQKWLLHDVLMMADHELTGTETAEMAGARIDPKK
jgi:hypothetical protein